METTVLAYCPPGPMETVVVGVIVLLLLWETRGNRS